MLQCQKVEHALRLCYQLLHDVLVLWREHAVVGVNTCSKTRIFQSSTSSYQVPFLSYRIPCVPASNRIRGPAHILVGRWLSLAC
jgi:hypothetical protein